MKNDSSEVSRTVMLRFLFLVWFFLPGSTSATPSPADEPKDRHYTDAGFFDIHVCNWPNRKLFFMTLFSTIRYDEVTGVKVMDPDGRLLVQMDLGRYRIVNLKDQKEKHVFMNQVDIPEGSKDGVYSARITLSDGTVYTASDHVHIATMDRAGGLRPGNNEETTDPPAELRWDPVPGARYYQVFIKDQWNDGKQIYSSEVLSEPLLTLPQGLLKKGGLYSWFVHSRDVNEDPLLGDFNHGSLSSPVEFSVSD